MCEELENKGENIQCGLKVSEPLGKEPRQDDKGSSQENKLNNINTFEKKTIISSEDGSPKPGGNFPILVQIGKIVAVHHRLIAHLKGNGCPCMTVMFVDFYYLG